MVVKLLRLSLLLSSAHDPRLSTQIRATGLSRSTKECRTRCYVRSRDHRPGERWANPIGGHALAQRPPKKRYFSLYHYKQQPSNRGHRAPWIKYLLLWTITALLVEVSEPEVASLDTTPNTVSTFRLAKISQMSPQTAIVYINSTDNDEAFAQNWGKQLEMVELILSPGKRIPAWPLPSEDPSTSTLRVAISNEDGLIQGRELHDLVEGRHIGVKRTMHRADAMGRGLSPWRHEDPLISARCRSVVQLTSGEHPFAVIQIVYQHLYGPHLKDDATGSQIPKTFDVIWAAPVLEDNSAKHSLPNEVQVALEGLGLPREIVMWLNQPKNRIIFSELGKMSITFPEQFRWTLLLYRHNTNLAVGLQQQMGSLGWGLEAEPHHHDPSEDKNDLVATCARLPDALQIFGPRELHETAGCYCALSGPPVACSLNDHVCRRLLKTKFEDLE